MRAFSGCQIAVRSFAAKVAASLALVVIANSVVIPVVEAKERKPLRVTVQKRSIFDAGRVVPAGSMNRYASNNNYASPAYSFTGDRFGEGTLPSRIGAGTNPFSGTWSSPRW
jgi:hypothetical protein